MSQMTAVVLAYNEAELLPITLPPIKAVCEQVIIVDMGSYDETLTICRDILASSDLIVDYPRENLSRFGFAHARNFGAAHVKTEWVFAVDCDEYLVEDEFKSAKESLRSTSTDVFSIDRVNYIRSEGLELSDLSGILASPPPSAEGHRRIYRNRPRIRFEGPVHEEVWIGDVNAYDHCQLWPARLHHLNQYKNHGSEHLKYGLYSYLSLKAIEFPAFRYGTNSYWFTTFPQSNLASMLTAAADYAQSAGVKPINETNVRHQLELEGILAHV